MSDPAAPLPNLEAGPVAGVGGGPVQGDDVAATLNLGRPDFEIGLALAGAISAGAYTAGVIDFLAQALQEWEKHRGHGAPEHRVRIRTIAGASAGAITGALGIVALKRGIRPVPLSDDEIDALRKSGVNPNERQRIRCVLPGLYDAWVERPRMVADRKGAQDLLGFDDLKPEDQTGSRKAISVKSLLNGRLLDQIAQAVLEHPRDDLEGVRSEDEHLRRSAGPLPFLAETMHVYMTVTNLRGVPFDVKFGKAVYGMLTHGDRLHYRIENVGAKLDDGEIWHAPAFLRKDTFTRLDANTLPTASGEVPKDWCRYGNDAIASGAFPGGLSPRLIETPFGQYDGRQYPLPTAEPIPTNFPEPRNPDKAFRFLSVDGGVVNNSPFDFVEYALWDRGEQRRTGLDADRAVLLVAPFPEPPGFLVEGQPQAELGAVVRALIPTLLNQARFRASELGAAFDKDDRSRFMISPRRSMVQGPKELYPIACGLLGGFGGFLDREFRAHDYQLGRRNCQHFLASVFSLPASNHAIRAGGEANQMQAAPRNDSYNSSGQEFMIVPLVGEAKREVGLPPWPQMSGSDFQILLRRIAKRFDKIKGPLVKAQIGKTEIRTAARLLLVVSRERILNFVEMTILADLVRRNQIKGWDLPASVVELTDQAVAGRRTDDVRLILASLVGPARISATATQIAEATHLDEDFVVAVLDRLRSLRDDEPHRVLQSGGVYRLQMHEPVGMRAWPVIGSRIERFFPQPYRYS